jgi:hypothetical protein
LQVKEAGKEKDAPKHDTQFEGKNGSRMNKVEHWRRTFALVRTPFISGYPCATFLCCGPAEARQTVDFFEHQRSATQYRENALCVP